MPPCSKPTDTVNSDDVKALIDTDTKDHNNRADIVIGGSFLDAFEPWSVIRTTAVAGVAIYAVDFINLFDSYFWIAVVLVSFAVDCSSMSLNVVLQYIFPIWWTVQLAVAGIYPTMTQALLFLPTVLLLIGVPMSVCLHRYFSHTAFDTSRVGQFVVGLVSTMAYQTGPLWWAAKHVRHHHFCDQPEDPHSAKQRGFVYGFVLWTMNPVNHAHRDYKYNDPVHMVPEMFFLDRFYLAPPALVFTCMELYWERSTIIYSMLIPMLLCRIITLFFNVEFHPATNPKRCKSINDPRLLALIVGESQHDTHHKKPALSKRNDWDIPYWLTLAWMEPLGLVWNCR